jgi:hypothetical protein
MLDLGMKAEDTGVMFHIRKVDMKNVQVGEEAILAGAIDATSHDRSGFTGSPFLTIGCQ